MGKMLIQKSDQVKHAELYAKIPSFSCKSGCTDCCGPVPFSKWEWNRVTDKRQITCLDCPYIEKENCSIYADRPLICRLFGTVDDPLMTCPHGCGPEKKFTAEEGRQIVAAYKDL